MKIQETHFDHYIQLHKDKSLHPQLSKIYDKFPDKISNLKNLIFYGPNGVGKYTQMLAAIKKYSPSELKYEKKLSITYNKNVYFFKISDIHYEIDMSLIGCHSKMLWNDIYNQIVDILLSKQEKSGIIVCKYFHEIHSELLEIFYSYMQTLNTKNIDLKFIIITEELSFIPDNIINCCHLINVPRPSKTTYNKCLKIKINKNINLSEITNIKYLKGLNDVSTDVSNDVSNDVKNININENICSLIVDFILNYNDDEYFFCEMRENLYDVFIYNLNPYECVWIILNKLIFLKKIKSNQMTDILIKTHVFLQYYNNNYRPIYHFENFIMFLTMNVLEGENHII